jgi:hypothetical protein
MTVAALLAGAGAVYFTKQNLDTANFHDAIQLVRNDTRAFWCKRAGVATPLQDATGETSAQSKWKNISQK